MATSVFGVVVADRRRGGPASTDHAGMRYVFVPDAPGGAWALDVERRDATVSDDLRRTLGAATTEEALRVWTELEVIAKVTDVPVFEVLRGRHARGRDLDGSTVSVDITRADTPTHFVAIGRRSGAPAPVVSKSGARDRP